MKACVQNFVVCVHTKNHVRNIFRDIAFIFLSALLIFWLTLHASDLLLEARKKEERGKEKKGKREERGERTGGDHYNIIGGTMLDYIL